MKNKKPELLENQFPAVDLLYPIAVNSYQVSMTRVDVMDGRLQTVLAFVVTVSAAIIPLAAGQQISLRSLWFYLAMGIFAVCIVVGMVGRLHGEIYLLRPSNLKTWVTDSEWTFMKDMIQDAAEQFDHNMRLAKFRWWCSVVISLLFVAEAICLVVWVLASLP